MTENDNSPPTPTKQTSSVPLKKETVRVTLKAADAPPAVPSSAVPMSPPVIAPVPGTPPTPTTPAPTIPLRPVGKPMSAPAPTIRLATTAAPTSALAPGAASPTLPKATVQLQAPTRPLGTSFPTSSQIATFKVEDEDEAEPDTLIVRILSGLGFAAALTALGLQLQLADIWISGDDANPRAGDWMQLIK
jgi:hypothetical protein